MVLIIILSISLCCIGFELLKNEDTNKLHPILLNLSDDSCDKFYKVSGESMYPNINSSDVVEVDICFPTFNLRVSDIIVYRAEDGSLVGHRIIFLDVGNRVMLTLGDNVEEMDDPVNFSQYYGKIVRVLNEHEY